MGEARRAEKAFPSFEDVSPSQADNSYQSWAGRKTSEALDGRAKFSPPSPKLCFGFKINPSSFRSDKTWPVLVERFVPRKRKGCFYVR